MISSVTVMMSCPSSSKAEACRECLVQQQVGNLSAFVS